jgi:hypothetical protein
LPNRDTRSFVLRLAAEFVVIVIGVLVALGVDSWATSQRERALESDYLARLLDDVRFDLQELALVDSVSRTGLGASRRLSAPDFVDSVPASRVVSAVLVVGNNRVPDLSRSTFTELVNSGQIDLIRSDSVRRALASYDRTINELSEGWNVFDPGVRRWYAARVPQEVHERFERTEGCTRDRERPVYAFQVICDFDLQGWSAERLEADVRSEAGQEVFRMAGHHYAGHQFFASLLMGEARSLERVLTAAVSDR